MLGLDLRGNNTEYIVPESGMGCRVVKMIEECRQKKRRVFIDEKIEDGSVVHAFARRISINPVTGSIAAAVAVLAIDLPKTDEISRKYNELGMSFTKDAKTGVYLDCNQAFADYAHKERAEDVVGLTDFEI